ncbi:hypothetical protein J4479_05625 [Candidatus Woesearchaeota archaeon]|nr:hypothetical protein [Candidatus Woesearchaeota archaeon]
MAIVADVLAFSLHQMVFVALYVDLARWYLPVAIVMLPILALTGLSCGAYDLVRNRRWLGLAMGLMNVIAFFVALPLFIYLFGPK